MRLENIAVRVGERTMFEGTSWTIRRGEHWAVIGPNGSGKTTLVRALCGRAPIVAGTAERLFDRDRPGAMGYVSFEQHVEAMRREAVQGRSRYFGGHRDEGKTCAELIRENCPAGNGGEAAAEDAMELLGIPHLSRRPLRLLSAGEMKRTLIARALAAAPDLLVLDEPCAALDQGARERLLSTIADLMRRDLCIVLVTHRLDELPDGIDGLVVVRDSSLVYAGPRGTEAERAAVMSVFPAEVASEGSAGALTELGAGRKEPVVEAQVAPQPATLDADDPAVVVRLSDVTVRYGPTVVLDRLDWSVGTGEKWAIVGPNGSGKTTIADLIWSENPQAYANEVRVAGRRRGDGESVWELRRWIGYVSPELQVAYRKAVTSLEVVASGFFDSIGIYRHCTDAQKAAAARVMRGLGISGLAERPFRRMSFGEQRMVLIARAVVKQPRLLLFDEPCQGLDPSNRARVIGMIDSLASDEAATTVIYISHYRDELPACITHLLELDGAGGSKKLRLIRQSANRAGVGR